MEKLRSTSRLQEVRLPNPPIKDVPTTMTRMNLGESSFGAPSLKFTVALSFTKTLPESGRAGRSHLRMDLVVRLASPFQTAMWTYLRRNDLDLAPW
jgi:hypothetical protein